MCRLQTILLMYGYAILFLLRLQRASLLLHPYPRRCLGLYSCWGFAPSSRLTLVAAQYLGRCSCYGFTSQLFKCKLPNYLQVCPAFLVTSAAQYPVIYTCLGFAPQLYVSPIVIQYFDRDIFYNFRFIDSNNWICSIGSICC